MKILLDENIPVQFREFLPDEYEWFTVRDMRWHGIKNGQLLKLLSENQFYGMLTLDKNLHMQQNISQLGIVILLLRTYDNKLPTLMKYINLVNDFLKSNSSQGIHVIEVVK